MSKRLLTALVATYAVLCGPALAAKVADPPAIAPWLVPVIEFHHAGLDHYFMSAYPGEVAALDSGRIEGWRRTGAQFTAFASLPSDPNLSPVCRYFGTDDSHFFSASADECAAVGTRFAGNWMLETPDAFQVRAADARSGACPENYSPVYRLYNARADANHRYTSDPNVVSDMVAQGYVLEGSGTEPAVFCAATAPGAPSAPEASLLATSMAVDTFQFSGVAVPSGGASVASYAWDYGDGETGTGATNWHRYGNGGTFPVVLTMTDSAGKSSRATRNVVARPHVPPQPPSAADASADFERRRSSPGVVRWFDFDTQAQLGTGAYGANFGGFSGTTTAPVIDTSVAASGSGSLRFDVASQSGPNGAGSWYANFAPDLSVQFGENSEFYVQWRQRFSKAFMETYFNSHSDATGPGIKQLIVTTGDRPGRLFNSCEAIGNVITSYYQRRFSIAYNSCTGSRSHGPYAGFYEQAGGHEVLLQNALPPPSCPYTAMRGGRASVPPSCFGWEADEWMTFQIGVTLGPRDNASNEFTNSRFRLWAAREGEPAQLLIDWKPGVRGYFPLTAGPAAENQRYGKVFLLPYMTGKDPAQVHELAQTWYDELIISTQRIPDPAPVVKAADDFPAWRKGKPVGQFFEIPNTANLDGALPPEKAGTIDAWNGFAAGPTSFWSAAASGHREWWNPVLKIDLAADAPRWELVHAGSSQADVNRDAYYADGLPASRHTYYTTQFINGRNAQDGQDRVMLFGSYAAYAIDYVSQGGFGGGSLVDGFRVLDGNWDPAGTWPRMPFYAQLPSIAKDPRTDDVYYCADFTLTKWTAKTNTWTPLIAPPNKRRGGGKSSAQLDAWNYMASVVDVKRNRLVALVDGRPYRTGRGLRLQTIDLSTIDVSDIPVTGDLSAVTTGRALVHDLDGDRYLYFMRDTVYAIDPNTGVSTVFARVQAPVVSVENRAAYFPQLGGVAYLPRFSSNIWFLPTR